MASSRQNRERRGTAAFGPSVSGRTGVITVSIGQEFRSGPDITESWINDQINRRLRDNARICVTITVKKRELNMMLRTAGCPMPRRPGRAPNGYERRVFDLWEKLDLQNGEVRGGKLVAFLKQMGAL